MPLSSPRRRALAALLVTALFGCQAETFGADELPIGVGAVTVVAGVPIAGGRVALTAPWMSSAPETLLVSIDAGAATAMTRTTAAADRFWLTLPDDIAPGWHNLVLHRGAHELLPIGSIGVGGWAPMRSVPGELASSSAPVLPLVPGLASMDPGQRIEVLDARLGTLRYLDTLRASASDIASYRLGSSVVPNSFTMMVGYFSWHRMAIGIASPRIDSATPPGVAYTMVHQIGDGAWFYQDFAHFSFLDVSGASREFRGHHFAERIAISDDGRWMIPSHEYSDSGLLVLDATDWSYRYLSGWGTADASIGTNGAAYVLGTRNGRWYQGVPLALARLDPATGTIAVERKLADSVSSPNASDIGKVAALHAIDAVLVMRPSGTSLDLTFFDPATLDPIGHLAIPRFYSSCATASGWEPMVIEDPTFHRLYFTPDYCTGGNIPIATLQLPD